MERINTDVKDFTIKKKIRGVTITDDIIRELHEPGHSHIMKFVNGSGKQYLAHLEVVDGKVKVVPEAKYLTHRCPHCGGRILITSKGYYCEHCFGKHPSCKFHCNGILSHRFITPAEFEAYLDGHPTIIDGCFNSQGRIFSAKLIENDFHGMSLTSVVGTCPVCGDKIMVSPVAFNCVGHHQIGEPYHLSLWRNIRGHAVTLDELHGLLSDKITHLRPMSGYDLLVNGDISISEDKVVIKTDVNKEVTLADGRNWRLDEVGLPYFINFMPISRLEN